MILAGFFLAIAAPAQDVGPTASDLFTLIERDQVAFAMALEDGAFPDTSLNIKKIESYRCRTAEPKLYRCTVRYRGLTGRKITLRLLVKKSDTTWVMIDPQTKI